MKTKTKQKQKIIYVFIAIFSLLISIFPFNFEHIFSKNAKAQYGDIVLDGDIHWTPTDNPGEFRYDKYTITGSLTIEAGTHLRLLSSEIKVNGNLFIEGEKNNPVVIEGSDSNSSLNYTISAGGGSEVDVNYAVFRGGGGYDSSCQTQAPWILNTALAEGECILGALNVGGDNVVIRNSTFEHNFSAVNFGSDSTDSYLVDNIFDNNEDAALHNPLDSKLNAQGNCWMRPSGPTHSDNPKGLGEKIIGNVDFANWKDCGTDHKPVLIIPGIGGSWNWDVLFGDVLLNEWNFPPTIHDYDSLIKSLENKGYKKGKDLRIVFYDWRKDNHESAENFLTPVIDDLKKTSFDEKYDVVAHSMGGIVTMDYFQNHDNEIIDKIVLLGTPLGGSAKAYPVWEGGRIPDDWKIFELYLWYQWFGHGGSNFDLIRQHIPSVKQLLPIYDYTISENATKPNSNYDMQEYNQYLDDLFWNIDNFFGENTLIVEGSDIPTSKMIEVKEYHGDNEDKIWKDGEPLNNSLVKDEAQGDGTVVNASSAFDFLPTDPNHPLFHDAKQEKLPGIKHTQLPTAAIAEIHDFLFTEQPPIGDYPFPSENKLVFAFASPVDVKIIAPDEKYITKSENTIGKAYYYSDGQDDGAKIVEVEDPTSGEYKVELTGNGNGEYHILASKQNGDNYDENETQGQIATGQNLNYKVDTAAENFEIQSDQSSADTTPPAIVIASPEDQKTYLNEQYALSVDYTITDETTANENITKNIQLDGQPFIESQIDLSLQKLGGHSFKITAIDEAGNKSEQSIAFHVSTDLDAIQKNISHYWDIKLIKNKRAKRFLAIHLRHLENFFNLLEKIENSKLKPKAKQATVDALKKVINADINLLVRQINRKSPRWIDQIAANFLIEDLNSIRP